jgi:3-oxoadipate enol-lactonase
MKIASNGIHIHVNDQGRGEPALVFLHYWGGSSRTWRAVIGALPSTYRTVAPDLRGWGESDAPSSGYALADFADDVQGVIDTLKLDRFVLVGHSMGGKIAQLLASRRPRGLEGLVLVAPSPPAPMDLPAEARAQMASAYDTRASVEASIDHMLTAKPLSAAQREQVIADSLRGAAEAKHAWPAHASREDLTREVASIAVPAMVIAGEMDRVDSVDTLRTHLLPHIPHATLQVVPGSGHLSPLEAPREVAALIHGFVESLGPKAK